MSSDWNNTCLCLFHKNNISDYIPAVNCLKFKSEKTVFNEKEKIEDKIKFINDKLGTNAIKIYKSGKK